ncbi:hypothetical protein P8452_63942 [Trifolium repens]|nr:hypothetical protein P8452_63942 [Trifolium repens]
MASVCTAFHLIWALISAFSVLHQANSGGLSKRLPKHLTQVAWVEGQRHVVLMWRLPILNVDCGGLYDGDEHALLHMISRTLHKSIA